MADATPSFSQVTITPQSADVYVEASWEAVQDSNIEAQLSTLFADAKDRLEAAAFTTGAGASGVPEGIVSRLAATTASRVWAQTNATFGAIDIYNMFKARPVRYQPNVQWLAAYQFEADVRQFAMGSGPQHAFWADMGQGTPPLLLGKGWNGTTGMTSSLSSATASSDDILVYGDFKQAYLIADRQGSFIARNDMVVGNSCRPTGTTGWVYWWRTGANTLNSDAARLLRV